VLVVDASVAATACLASDSDRLGFVISPNELEA